MINANQKGFAVVETLLIVAILAIIGGTGYFVWHAKQNTESSLNNTTNSQQAISKQTKKAPTNSSSSPTTQIKYLVINEWGVKFPYAGDDTLSYKIEQTPDAASIISANLAKAFPGCDAYGAGNIGRGHANDSVDESGQTLGQQYQANPASIGKVGDYYYSFGHNQAACASTITDAAAKAQSAANDFVKAIVPKAQAE